MAGMTNQKHKNQVGQASANGGEFAAKTHSEADTTLAAYPLDQVMDYAVGETMVRFEHNDEGLNGDFDPADPDDRPLLRVSVLRNTGNGVDDWEYVEGASWCTGIVAGHSDEQLRQLCNRAATALDKVYDLEGFKDAARRVTEGMEGLNRETVSTFDPAGALV